MRDMVMEQDPSRIQKERESFVILQHVYTVTDGDPAQSVSCSRVGTDLGFLEARYSALVEHLIWIGYLAWATPGLEVSITQQGREYIERRAWRRRSVRSPALA